MIIYHADDYGISVNASKDILSLVEKGALNSFSIMPNMSCFKECMELLTPVLDAHRNSLTIALHINLFEGHCCADPKDIPLLVNPDGMFQPEWTWFFWHSYLWGRNKLRKQLAIEIAAQIKQFLIAMPMDYVLCLDSHQHSHMIPVVWDALKDVVTQNKYHVQYVRISREPLVPYLRCPYLYRTYSNINIIKNLVIQFCSIHTRLHPIIKQQGKYRMWGLIMGGTMDFMRIQKLMPLFKKYGKDPDTLELLFHPGLLLQTEVTEEYNKREFVNAETSPCRETEHRSLLRLSNLPTD